MSGGDSGEGSSQSGPSEFEWELCRENVKPLKTGRRIDAINQALAHAAYGPKAETLANEKFDETMGLCEASSDPLKHCLDFCTWFEQTFPHGRQRLFYSLLWKIVHKYAKLPEYLEDERMARIWEKLADNSLGHGWEIYQHANNIGSLLRCAHLYILWCEDLEMRGAIADARAVLRLARKHGALPAESIDYEEDQLEMREMRRHLDAHKSGDDSWDEEEYDENGERVAFTRLTAADDSSAAPVVRLPCIVGEQGSSKLDRGKVKQNPTNNGVPEFQVFEDDGEAAENYLEGIYEVNNHIERFCLNDHNAEKWKASKVPLKKISNCVSTFTIWQDDDNKENTDPQTSKEVKKPVLKLRKCLIRDMSVEENLARIYENNELKQDVKEVARKINFDDDDE